VANFKKTFYQQRRISNSSNVIFNY